ncbi:MULTISPECIES: flagellar hook-basal body complex protein FliE [Rummeliibacillus]|uniref:flagellar hook-basal body complex protein FliE n=1 Tax=Rummeliibacillus TaxID=648802 RepID=UPI00116C0C79|nr:MULTISPECIES: flagellar hook-basal body complex protein FliE [Rummeliibacillus]MBB5169886.1 flagellar hook-basal body complex protein FliE [Rummeliibacillus stabekisii]GEL04144.1 flagellar hook-basal body complex protein FliE [Rummeliibacillus stabekisii]
MAISQVSISQPVQPAMSQTAIEKTSTNEKENFGAVLKDAISAVNNSQVASDNMTNRLVNGENVELHDVMITAQKANITLNTALQIRNKVVEAYQEIMRMTV